MATGQIRRAIEQVRERLLAHDPRGLSDAQLLDLFVHCRDEDAFTALVRRHGPMVLGVCRRVLGNAADAEDAFQATFLVLAKKAAALSRRELMGNWLHGVAYRTALKSRGVAARRRLREQPMANLPHPRSEATHLGDDLRAVLDEELRRLPERYRLAVVLCELEGRPRKEVAGQLAIPEGTLSSRLATARRLLAQRLSGRGFTPSGAALTAVLSPGAATACFLSGLVRSTVKAAAGEFLADTGSTRAAALTEGGMRTMFLSRSKVLAMGFWALAVMGIAAGLLVAGASGRQADGPAKPAVPRAAPATETQQQPAAQWQDLLAKIDPDKHTVGKGIWRLEGGKLTAYPAAHGARLRVPIVPQGNYELRARWEPKAGQSSVAFIVPHGDRMASVEVLTSFGCAGLGDLNGVRPDVNETKTAVRIKPGKVYEVVIRVTVDGPVVQVMARLDQQTIVDWKGKRSELEHAFFAPPKPASLGLGVGGDVSVFHRLELRMLQGTATLWKPAGKPGEDQ